MSASRSVFVPGEPVSQGSKTLMRGRMVDAKPAQLRAWRDAISWQVRAAGWHREPLTGPVAVALRFVLPHLKTPRYWSHTRPDLDKLARGVNDALTAAGAWQDDAQAAQMHLTKHHGLVPGVHIRLDPITDRPEEMSA